MFLPPNSGRFPPLPASWLDHRVHKMDRAARWVHSGDGTFVVPLLAVLACVCAGRNDRHPRAPRRHVCSATVLGSAGQQQSVDLPRHSGKIDMLSFLEATCSSASPPLRDSLKPAALPPTLALCSNLRERKSTFGGLPLSYFTAPHPTTPYSVARAGRD